MLMTPPERTHCRLQKWHTVKKYLRNSSIHSSDIYWTVWRQIWLWLPKIKCTVRHRGKEGTWLPMSWEGQHSGRREREKEGGGRDDGGGGGGGTTTALDRWPSASESRPLAGQSAGARPLAVKSTEDRAKAESQGEAAEAQMRSLVGMEPPRWGWTVSVRGGASARR